MPTRPPVPDLGTELAPYLADVPDGSVPVFLAGLERSAGDRYLGWAAQRPEHAALLRRCAEREHRIADLIEALHEVDDEQRAALASSLAAAVTRYGELFDPHDLEDQWYLQSEAELQGAAAWDGLALGASGDARSVLEECAALERASAEDLRNLLSGSTPPDSGEGIRS